jgi:hypothetical protein
VSSSSYITRASLSLGNLDIDTDPYKLGQENLDPGEVSWRRQWATSPFVHGSIEVNKTKDISRGTLDVLVDGAGSESTLRSEVATLITAFSQSSYELHLTVNSTDWAWSCFAADYAVNFDNWRMSSIAICKFSIFRKPIPVAGPY